MAKTQILGGHSVASSPNAAANRLVNLYPEAIPEGGKEPAFLSRCPGLKLVSTVGSGPVRGMIKAGNSGYVVSGKELYKMTSSFNTNHQEAFYDSLDMHVDLEMISGLEMFGFMSAHSVPNLIGEVSGNGPVSMAYNGTQIFIACNPTGYICDTVSDTLARIPDTDFPGAATVDYLDGYFAFNVPNSQKLYVTRLLDGNDIDALEYTSVEGLPDNVVAVKRDHRELWVFGADSTEVYYNSAALDFPLERISSAFIPTGCSAPYSIARLDNSLFWLGTDENGFGIVVRSSGFSSVVRVSDHSIEAAIQQYATIDDAIAYTYQQNGHSFYVLTFPEADKTWCYDVASRLWHERASFGNGEFHRHLSNCHMAFNGKTLVGDYRNGNIYAFDLNTYKDHNAPQKWVRAWRAIPTGQNSLKMVRHLKLQIDCETGVGLNDGQGLNPTMMLRWSNDGGHTWGNTHFLPMGRIGAFLTRSIRRNLGQARDRVYEISGTDPVKIAIMGAEIEFIQGVR